MDRIECEKAIAEHLIAIRDIYLQYYPEADYLSLSITKGRNGNDKGYWNCWNIHGNNQYYDKDKDYAIDFHAFSDIKDQEYWNCVTVDEDKEDEEYWKDKDNIHNMLLEGFWFSSGLSYAHGKEE